MSEHETPPGEPVESEQTQPGAKAPATPPAIDSMRVLMNQLVKLSSNVDDGFYRVNQNIDLLSGEVGGVKTDIHDLQQWKLDQDRRANKNSMRAKAISDSDLEQSAALAGEIAARQALAARLEGTASKVEAVDTKVDDLSRSNATQLLILQQFERAFANPAIKLLLAVAGVWATGYLAARGFK